jgi:hypothetical protein
MAATPVSAWQLFGLWTPTQPVCVHIYQPLPVLYLKVELRQDQRPSSVHSRQCLARHEPLQRRKDNTSARMHEDLPGGLIEKSPSAASALLAWSAWAVEEPEGVELPIMEELGGEL